METQFMTSTGYGNIICDKYWLREHIYYKQWLWEQYLWQVLVMGTWCVTSTG